MTTGASRGDVSFQALSRVVRQVDAAPDLASALSVLVESTRALMQVDVCTVYFTEQDNQRHVMVATSGLSPEVVGHVQFGFGKGLIGQVADSAQPVNLARVPPDLDQGFVDQTGDGCYHGFLGVPITHHSEVLGVLVVRHRSERRFDDAEAAVLVTLASQLGNAIAYAQASGVLSGSSAVAGEVGQSFVLPGWPGAAGVAIGTAVLATTVTDLFSVPNRAIGADDVELEISRYQQAVEQVKHELGELDSSLSDELSAADQALFDAYLMMLDSPEITDMIVAEIKQQNWAPAALRKAIAIYSQRFDAMDDPYLRERKADIEDLGSRILAHLQPEPAETKLRHYPDQTVLIGNRLTALDLGSVPRDKLVAIVSAQSSTLSHVIILARALGLPAVVGVGRNPLEYLSGQEVIVDGYQGRIHIKPDSRLRDEFIRVIASEKALNKDLGRLQGSLSETADAVRVPLHVNAGLVADLAQAQAVGAEGIGLFRTELHFMHCNRFPSEQEQTDVYRQLLEQMAPLPVTLRTLDVGGDKPLPYLPVEEDNPVLGWRGIRLTLDRPDVFLTQLRAVLRANVGLNNLRLMLPMVNDADEVERAIALLHKAGQQLTDEGVAVVMPELGVMIEVPSAVYQIVEIAELVDFISIGSNDLCQYLLAVDRNNPRVSRRLDGYHPAVLKAISRVITEAQALGKPVSLCGEMASDPAGALLLVGMGIDSLSLSTSMLPKVKWALSRVDYPRLKGLAASALQQPNAAAVGVLLDDLLVDLGLERLASGYSGKL